MLRNGPLVTEIKFDDSIKNYDGGILTEGGPA
jgi:hypothetical protein